MRIATITAPGRVELLDAPDPVPGPADVLVRIRACGICGSDAFYISLGGLPGLEGHTPLGHEPAGEVVHVGAEVDGVAVGDHVVVNPMAAPTGVIGSGGTTGALAELLLIQDAVVGRSLAVIPPEVPFEVAALNEPMAVARHAVNRLRPQPGDKAVVFGAGPIGLGAVLSLVAAGVDVVVVDVVPSRLAKALRVGASGAIDSSREDLAARLIELHGEGPTRRGVRKAGSELYLDAAGAPAVIASILDLAKHGATVGIVGVHKRPVEIDFGAILGAELTIVTAMGYPGEIFEVTADLVERWPLYQELISDVFPFERTVDALAAAGTPGVADKVVVSFA